MVQLVARPLLEFTVALEQEYNCRGLSGHDDQLGQQWLNPSAASQGIKAKVMPLALLILSHEVE